MLTVKQYMDTSAAKKVFKKSTTPNVLDRVKINVITNLTAEDGEPVVSANGYYVVLKQINKVNSCYVIYSPKGKAVIFAGSLANISDLEDEFRKFVSLVLSLELK